MTTGNGLVNRIGDWILVVACLAGLAVSVFNYLTPGNGITGSGGALLVIVSSALISLAALVLTVARIGKRWLRATIDVLLLLGIAGTGFAAYMLEADILLASMALAVVGWLAHLVAAPRRVARAAALQSSAA
jgi:hypothetical protein